MYSTKTALVIRADLLPWQVANVAAFLSGGLAGTYPEIVGEPYRDGDGRLYTPMIREPIFVYGATSVELTPTHGRAVDRGMRFAIYTEPLFKTTNDADNRASVAATSTAELDLVGLAIRSTLLRCLSGSVHVRQAFPSTSCAKGTSNSIDGSPSGIRSEKLADDRKPKAMCTLARHARGGNPACVG